MPKLNRKIRISTWAIPALLLLLGGYRFWRFQQDKSLLKLDDKTIAIPDCPPEPKDDSDILLASIRNVEKARQRAEAEKENPQAWITFAETAFANKDYLSTLSALQTLQKLQPALAPRQTLLMGYSLKECSLTRAALPLLREAVKAMPQNATAYVALSQCLSRLVKNDEAVEVLNQGARSIAISDLKGREELAREYEMHAEWDRALEQEKEAFAQTSNDPDLGTAVGLAMQNSRKVPEAQVFVEDMLRRFPNHGGLHRQLGFLLNSYQRTDKNPKLAEHHYLKAVSLNPKDAMAWRLLGDLYLNARRIRPAAYAFTRLLQLDAHNDGVRMTVARAYGYLGLDVGKVTGLTPGALGIRDQAEYFMRNLRYQDSSSPSSILQLPRHYIKNGQYVKAFQSLQAVYLLHYDKPAVPAECRALYQKLQMPQPLFPTPPVAEKPSPK